MKREIKRSMQNENRRVKLKNCASRLIGVKATEFHRVGDRKSSKRRRIMPDYRILL